MNDVTLASKIPLRDQTDRPLYDVVCAEVIDPVTKANNVLKLGRTHDRKLFPLRGETDDLELAHSDRAQVSRDTALWIVQHQGSSFDPPPPAIDKIESVAGENFSEDQSISGINNYENLELKRNAHYYNLMDEVLQACPQLIQEGCTPSIEPSKSLFCQEAFTGASPYLAMLPITKSILANRLKKPLRLNHRLQSN